MGGWAAPLREGSSLNEVVEGYKRQVEAKKAELERRARELAAQLAAPVQDAVQNLQRQVPGGTSLPAAPALPGLPGLPGR